MDYLSDSGFSKVSFYLRSMPFEALTACQNALWFRMIQISDVTGIEDVVIECVKNRHGLHDAMDRTGRVAIDVATIKNKQAIQSVVRWFGRYKVVDTQPAHQSATCHVYQAEDELSLTNGRPMRVALKLMRVKEHMRREVQSREHGFDPHLIMSILRTHPEYLNIGSEDVDVTVTVHEMALSKVSAERMYCIVMPLADKNLFVSLKQERWAGRALDEVRHVFKQLVSAVDHMHQRGVLHGDIKTLNIVRMDGRWLLIDLDAACELGKQTVGSKSSSAYIAPEALFVSNDTTEVIVRSARSRSLLGVDFDLLLAHPSFDIWSLGCVLYQMCHPGVIPLFQGDRDDNLSHDLSRPDNLFALANWTDELKSKKLSEIRRSGADSDTDTNRVLYDRARNLLSRMLSKSPATRPSIPAILDHPFVSGKDSVRMVGDPFLYDVFISYRVAADAEHAKNLHQRLSDHGLNVFWDKVCLKDGKPWETGFCEGLVNSRVFVALISEDAVAHPTNDRSCFSRLSATSACDNVLLEHQFALELEELGMLEYIYPVMIGKRVGGRYDRFNMSSYGALPNVSVQDVQKKLTEHMSKQALGSPLQLERTVTATVKGILAHQGGFVEGEYNNAIDEVVQKVTVLCRKRTTESSLPEADVVSGNVQEHLDHFQRIIAAKDVLLAAKDAENRALREQLLTLSKFH